MNIRILIECVSTLLEIAEAGDRASAFSRLIQYGQQHRRKNADDYNYDEELYK